MKKYLVSYVLMSNDLAVMCGQDKQIIGNIVTEYDGNINGEALGKISENIAEELGEEVTQYVDQIFVLSFSELAE